MVPLPGEVEEGVAVDAVGGGDAAPNAVDALTGDVVWRAPLEQRTTETPGGRPDTGY